MDSRRRNLRRPGTTPSADTRDQFQTPAGRPQAAPPMVTPVHVSAEVRTTPLGALVDDDEGDADYDDDETETEEHDEADTDAADEEESTHQDEHLFDDADEELDDFDDDEMMEHTLGHATRGHAQPFDAAARGLKEISNLGKFTVSSSKQGNGVDELRSDELRLYWQSDGPQPHKLTIYFIKRVAIREICFYVDAEEDESYTPTKMVFKSGTGENNLIEFGAMTLDAPIGWQRVPVRGAGGGHDGNTLYSYVLQIQILENHQNGKDTHLRGIKIYALDQDVAVGANEGTTDRGGAVGEKELNELMASLERELASYNWTTKDGSSGLPDMFRDPEIR